MSASTGYAGSLAHTMRHGHGQYRFRERAFAFEGAYDRGVRSGVGRLAMLGHGAGDAPLFFVEGEFSRGELSGFGMKTWADGSTYRGSFLEGEPHGQGRLELSEARAPPGSARPATWRGSTCVMPSIETSPRRCTAVMVCPSTATSAMQAGAPVPSIRVAPRITSSCVLRACVSS